jgi:hypothetical protein
MFSMEFTFIVLALAIGYVLYNYFKKEGFQAGMAAVRCGVDLPTCHPGLQCFNGFCSRSSVPVLPANELPVYP